MQQNISSTAVDTRHTFEVRNLSVYYSGVIAVRDVNMDILDRKITAFIGPSGCGKSTLLRCFNRTNSLIPGAKVKGHLSYKGKGLFDDTVDPIVVRRRIGMVFQQPNPFPKSIYDNVAYGLRVNGIKGNIDEIVETSLRRAAIWDEVKDKLKKLAGHLALGRSAAAPVHCPRHCRQPRRAAYG